MSSVLYYPNRNEKKEAFFKEKEKEKRNEKRKEELKEAEKKDKDKQALDEYEKWLVGVIDVLCLFFVFCFVFVLAATCRTYGSSQARGQIGAAATGLHHSHSNVTYNVACSNIRSLTH